MSILQGVNPVGAPAPVASRHREMTDFAALLVALRNEARESSPSALVVANGAVGATQISKPSEIRIPGAIPDADGDGRLTSVDIDAFANSGEKFRSPAELAGSLVATGARKLVFGENHFAPHPELVVATILEIERRAGESPVLFLEAYGGPFQGLVDDLQSGALSEREFAQNYAAFSFGFSPAAADYARKILVPQILSYHRAGARIVLLDDLPPADNRDRAWEARYAAEQASNPHAFSIFVVGGVHSQKSPSISDENFPENDFRRPIGVRIAERYGPQETLTLYVANSPRDAMAEIYEPAFSSWDAVLPMPRDVANLEKGMRPALPADEDGVPLLSPQELGAQWHAPRMPVKSLPKDDAISRREQRRALNNSII